MSTFSPFGLLPGMTLVLDKAQVEMIEERAKRFLRCLNAYERGVAIRDMEDNLEGQIMAQAGEFISLLSMQLPMEAWGEIREIGEPRESWDIRDHLAASSGLIDVKTTKIKYEYLFWPLNKPDQLWTSKAAALFLAKAGRCRNNRKLIEGCLYGWVSMERFRREHKIAPDGMAPEDAWKLDPKTQYMHQTKLDTDFNRWRAFGEKRRAMV